MSVNKSGSFSLTVMLLVNLITLVETDTFLTDVEPSEKSALRVKDDRAHCPKYLYKVLHAEAAIESI